MDLHPSLPCRLQFTFSISVSPSVDFLFILSISVWSTHCSAALNPGFAVVQTSYSSDFNSQQLYDPWESFLTSLSSSALIIKSVDNGQRWCLVTDMAQTSGSWKGCDHSTGIPARKHLLVSGSVLGCGFLKDRPEEQKTLVGTLGQWPKEIN